MAVEISRRQFASLAVAASAAAVIGRQEGSAHADTKDVPMTSLDVQPFQIAVPDTEIDDLRARLGRTRWPDSIPGSGWRYGTDLAWTKAMADYWQSGFDWREAEA